MGSLCIVCLLLTDNGWLSAWARTNTLSLLFAAPTAAAGIINSSAKDGVSQYSFHNGFGKPYFPETATATWRKFLKRHGLKHIRLHDLRHTAATLLIDLD